MFLVIDVGNTNIVFAVCEYNQKQIKILFKYRIHTNLKRTPDEYSFINSHNFANNNFSITKLTGVCMASVVPEALTSLKIFIEKFLNKPLLSIDENKLDVKIEIDNPRDAGQDRLINAFAIKKMNLDPAIIIDFGTATTFDIIGKTGSYEGGIISPGINLSIDSLYNSTSRLPKIILKSLDNEKTTLIGKNTTSAMESGIFWGYVCMIEGLINKLKKYYSNSKIIATGGLSEIFKHKISSIDFIEKDLTLLGLAYYYLSQKSYK